MIVYLLYVIIDIHTCFDVVAKKLPHCTPVCVCYGITWRGGVEKHALLLRCNSYCMIMNSLMKD